MDALFLLLFVVLMITLVGHALWVIAAAVFRGVFGLDSTSTRQQHCLSCGNPRFLPRCGACGFDNGHASARELADLAASSRQLERLFDAGLVDRSTYESMHTAFEARHERLLGRPVRRAAVPEPVPDVIPVLEASAASVAAITATPPAPATWQRLETALAGVDPDQIARNERAEAIGWYRQLTNADLDRLTAPAQLALARLLAHADHGVEALEVYRMLLLSTAGQARYARAALDAGRLALQLQDQAQAQWFLAQVLAREPAEPIRRVAEELREALAVPTLEVARPEPEPVHVPAAEPVAAAAVAKTQVEPDQPRRSVASVLAAFMERSNILWGELVGGMLIVGCTIALVISLWATLGDNPVYQSGIFVAVTALLFGGGLYTLHHWKLDSTSRGLLIIASLLVPLNFMASAAHAGTGGIAAGVLEIASLALFAWLLQLTGRVLTPGGSWCLPFAVLGASATTLFLPRFIAADVDSPWLLPLLALAPIACHVGGSGAWIVKNYRRDDQADEHSYALFTLLGVSTFAALVALGLFVTSSVQSGIELNLALAALALPTALAAVPLISGGLRAHQAVIDSDEVVRKIAGTATALLGVATLLLAVGLAWPVPHYRLAVCLFDVALMSWVAYRWKLPLLHVPALTCLAIAYLTGLHLSPLTVFVPEGALLVPLFVIYAGVSAWLGRRQLSIDAGYHGIAAGVIAAYSLYLITPFQFAAPFQAKLPTILYVFYGVCGLLLNARWKRPEVSAVSAALLVAGSLWGMAWNLPGDVPAWSALLAGEALLLGFGALIVGRFPRLEHFHEPLARSVEAIVPLALLAGVWSGWPMVGWTMAHIVAGVSLSLLFVMLASHEHSPARAWLSSGLMVATTLIATVCWLDAQAWFDQPILDRIVDPRVWQTFGIGLGLLCLLWTASRISLQRLRPDAWLEQGWPGVDRWLLGFVVCAQLGLTLVCLVPTIAVEWGFEAPLAEFRRQAFGPLGWQLLGLLGVVVASRLWERRSTLVVPALWLLAVTVPVLNAGAASSYQTSTALCLGLAGVYLASSALIWLRAPIAHCAGKLRCEAQTTALPDLSRVVLIVAAFVPVVVLSLLMALRPFADLPILGLPAGMLAARGWLLILAVPLVMLCLGCIGHAVRERFAGYAFTGGLLALGTVTLVWALDYKFLHQVLSAQLCVEVLQLGGLAAAVWALGWLFLRGRLGIDKASVYLNMQAALIGVGALVPTAVAVVLLFLSHPPAVSAWTVATGSALGWLTLAVSAFALHEFGRQQRQELGLRELGFVGLAALGLLACTIAGPHPAWGYRSLMLSWAAYPLLLASAGWIKSLRSDEEGYLPHAWVDALTIWVPTACVLAIGLALKAAFVHGDLLYAALACALACPALAGVGVWRREEGWAFAAGFGVNLAASFALAHYQREVLIADWWVLLMQANVTATSAVALLWLALRQKLYGKLELSLNTSRLLAMQVMLALAGNFLLLAVPACTLFADPGLPLASSIQAVGHVWGWLALVMNLIALGWYGDQIARPTLHEEDQHWFAPRSSTLAVGLLALFGVGVGVLSAGLVSSNETGNWLAFHVLLADCVIAALGCFGVGYWLARRESRGDHSRFHSPHATQPIMMLLGGLVVLLSLRGILGDPYRPYYSSAALLCISALATGLAWWTPRARHVFASGLLVNVAAFVMWAAGNSSSFETLLASQALAFAASAAAWSLWHVRSHHDGVPTRSLLPLEASFTRFASLAAVGLLALIVARSGWATLIQQNSLAPESLSWLAFAATTLLLGIRLWHRQAHEAAASLYALGVLGIGLTLGQFQLDTHAYLQFGTLALAGYHLLASFVPGRDETWRRLRLTPAENSGLSWFVPVQFFLASVVLAGGLWMSLALPMQGNRLLGALAILLLVPGLVRLARLASEETLESFDVGELLRYFTLTVGAVGLGAFGWAHVANAGHVSIWIALHRTLVFQVSLSLVTVLYGVFLARFGMTPAWSKDCRRAGPVFGLLALLTLLVVLCQEGILYNAHLKIVRLLGAMQLLTLPAGFEVGVPVETMGWLAVGVVTLSLIGLIVAGISFAVAPGRDPFSLSERGRMYYIYGVELVGLFLFLHLKITREEMFRSGVFLKYWPFLIMVIAFVGVGLSEYFTRRQLRVLAEPLGHTGVFLPILPVLAFWVMPATSYAALWLTLGLLYGLLATSRRSFPFALLAALSANMGLWVFLSERGFQIWEHPQLWLIPPAIIALASEHINRARLDHAQSASIRYLALLIVYVSSTADMFIAGLGESWLLPIVLVSLSVAGILLGMLLRIRAFLLLGSSFLTLVIFTMIWYAGVQQERMWIVYMFGIALGAAIIALFGLFEKRRNDVLRVIDELKQWR